MRIGGVFVPVTSLAELFAEILWFKRIPSGESAELLFVDDSCDDKKRQTRDLIKTRAGLFESNFKGRIY